MTAAMMPSAEKPRRPVTRAARGWRRPDRSANWDPASRAPRKQLPWRTDGRVDRLRALPAAAIGSARVGSGTALVAARQRGSCQPVIERHIGDRTMPTGRSILIVDDDAGVREMLADRLADDHGFTIFTA